LAAKELMFSYTTVITNTNSRRPGNQQGLQAYSFKG